MKCSEEKRAATAHVCTEPACTYAETHARDLKRHQKRKHPKAIYDIESDSESDIPSSQVVREVPVTTKVKVSLSRPDVAPTRKATKPLPVFVSARKRQLIEQLAAEVQSPQNYGNYCPFSFDGFNVNVRLPSVFRQSDDIASSNSSYWN